MEREIKLLLQRSITFKERHIYYFDSPVIDLQAIPSALSSAHFIFLFILHVSLLFTLHARRMIVEGEVRIIFDPTLFSTHAKYTNGRRHGRNFYEKQLYFQTFIILNRL